MTLDAVAGQENAVVTLRRAMTSGRLHHAYRFEGPPGVGKEMAAFGLAQRLVCERGVGCDQCGACVRARRPEAGPTAHPDVLIVERGLYEPEQIGRKRAELAEISVDQIRAIILPHAAYPPHEGRARVFIIRRAEELSISAANALLKTLEEPRPDVHFLLLTGRPDRLLTTIRSRTMPVRFGALSEKIVREILASRGIESERIDAVAPLAEGSVENAMFLLDPERSLHRQQFVDGLFGAILGRRFADAIGFAESADKGREGLRGLLDAFSAVLAQRGRALAFAGDDASERYGKAHERITQATLDLEQNASTSLLLIDLCADLRRLALPPPPPPTEARG